MTKKPIAGEFEIRDKDGKVIETVVTDKDGHAESKKNFQSVSTTRTALSRKTSITML